MLDNAVSLPIAQYKTRKEIRLTLNPKVYLRTADELMLWGEEATLIVWVLRYLYLWTSLKGAGSRGRLALTSDQKLSGVWLLDIPLFWKWGRFYSIYASGHPSAWELLRYCGKFIIFECFTPSFDSVQKFRHRWHIIPDWLDSMTRTVRARYM